MGFSFRIKAKVYLSLTEEERLEVALDENLTKTKISLTDWVQGIWNMYAFLNRGKLGLTEQNILEYGSFWKLPSRLKEEAPLAELARHAGWSERKTAGALRYASLHEEIRKEVQTGKFSYSFAQELGRIENKKEQLEFLGNIKRNWESRDKEKIKSRETLSKLISQYLAQQKGKDQLLGPLFSNPNRTSWEKSLEQEVQKATKVMSTLGTLLTIDGQILNGRYECHHGDLTVEEMLYQTKELTDLLIQTISKKENYQKLLTQVNRKGRNLKDQFLTGNFSVKEKTPFKERKNNIKELIDQADYKIVSKEEVFPDKNQPRKDVNQERLLKLGESIKKWGFYSPILVKKEVERYKIIVGESRYRASQLKGVEKIEILVVKLDDEQCRIVQFAEDIFERVILSQRAEHLYRIYQSEKRKTLDLTIPEFATRYSQLGQAAVENAINFASLPETVKKMHEEGVLHYSTAVAIANEWNRKEKEMKEKMIISQSFKREDWTLDWAVQSSLLDYKAEELRRKIYDSINQLSLRDTKGIYLDAGMVEVGRRRVAAKKLREILELLKGTNVKVEMIKDKKLIEKIILFEKNQSKIYRLLPPNSIFSLQ